MLFHGPRAAHEFRTTRCLIQTRNVKSLDRPSLRAPVANAAKRRRNKFLRYFPQAFTEQKYIDWDRDYQWTAHQHWQEILGQEEYRPLTRRGETMEVAAGAVRIESRTNLLFSFEKMALRDAVIPPAGSSALVLRLVNRLAHGCFWCSLRTLSKV
jgi:hypothetical protein